MADPVVDTLLAHRLDVLRYGEDVRRQITGLLDTLSFDVRREIIDADPGESFSQPLQRRLFARLQATITSSYHLADSALKEEMASAAEVENRFGIVLLKRLAPGSDPRILSADELKEALATSLVHGAPATDWLSKQATDLNLSTQQQIRLGVAANEPTSTIVHRVSGKKSKLGYVGGVFDRARREATAVVKTAIHSVTSWVAAKIFGKNPDAVGGRQWLSVLDSRTSIQCAALDGSAWDDEGNPLPTSRTKLKFPGNPPIHLCCRSLILPLRVGQAPVNSFSYSDWLLTQPVTVQQDVLGMGRWRLWKSGKLTLPELVDPSSRPLTLKALQARIHHGK